MQEQTLEYIMTKPNVLNCDSKDSTGTPLDHLEQEASGPQISVLFE